MANENTFACEISVGAATMILAAAVLWLIGTVAGPDVAIGFCRATSGGGACEPALAEALRASRFWAPVLSGLIWVLMILACVPAMIMGSILLSSLGRVVLSELPRKKTE